MSYSTRRSGGFGGQQQQQQNVSNIGQRRPVVTNNFVPAGQNKPPGQATQQQPVRAQQSPQQNTSIQFRNQGPTQQQAKQQPPQAKQQPPQAKQQPLQAKQPQPPVKQEQPQAKFPQQPTQQQAQVQQQATQLQQQAAQQTTLPTQQPAAQAIQPQPQQQQVKMETSSVQNNTFDPAVENPVAENADLEAMDTSGEVKKKSFWAFKKGKIAKREKNRRRNVILSQTLKPKNAVMILNELVKSTTYAVEELPSKVNGNSFKATVVYEGSEHVGFGRTKMQAKNVAAEIALKHFVKSHKLSDIKKDEEGNEKMDLSEDDVQNPLPWQHVVSFALFKLFCSWDDVTDSNTADHSETHELKPSKKMPPNPESVNPLMMVNQMLPQAHFEEIGKTGVPPNIVFSFKCTIDDQTFLGTGPNKKAAKRMAAYGACHKILGINYPLDVYVPNY